ncbi:MAG: DnaB-like helicase C-terminal domain-containing protein [Syntrophobacteraceae bacterium]
MPVELPHRSPDFIVKVLALMYHKPEFLRAVASSMSPEYFNCKVDEVFAEMFLDFFKKYPKSTLTKTVVHEELGRLVDKKRITESDLHLYMGRFEDILRPVPEWEYIEAKVGEFLETRAMELALVDSIDFLKKGKLDEILDEISKARSVKRTGDKEREFFIFGDDMEEYVKELEDPAEEERLKGVPTGIRGLDDLLLWGGIDTEEMLIDCGPPGRGKSISLLNKAIWANLHGDNILYYTLEVSRKVYRMRYYACLTGVPIIKLRSEAETFKKRWARLRELFPKMGKFILRDLPARALKPSTIKQDIRFCRDHGRDIKGVVVDYADIMSADKKFSTEDKRLEVGNIYEELRRIGKEFKVYIYSASQGNRASLNKAEIDIDSLAEDFSKAFTADYVCGLCQSKAEAMERSSGGIGTGIIRIFLAKNRNERSGINIPIMTDYTRARMSVHDWAMFDERVLGTE